jgi:tetratricopeptide (TPR) repeat protein
MSKHKKAKSVSKKKQKQKNKNDASQQKVPSIKELIAAGDAATAALEPDQALTFYASAEKLLQKTLPLQTSSLIYVLEKLGELKASEFNDPTAAKQDFEQAIALLLATKDDSNATSPTTSSSSSSNQETLAGLHLYIGQLSSEQEALEAYKKGLQCLETSIKLRQHEDDKLTEASKASMEVESDNKIQPTSLKELRQKLASARVNMAELYLTDLCYEDNAERECEAYVTLALSVKDDEDGESMIDALQTAASLKLSQQRTDEARTFILRAYQKISVGCEALSDLVGSLGNNGENASKRSVELLEVDAAEGLPSFDFRLQTAKILLECSARNNSEDKNGSPKGFSDKDSAQAKCNAASIHVLGSLLAENDEVPDVWYLLGCAYRGQGNCELATFYWSRALELLSIMLKDLEAQQEDGDDMQVEDGDDEEQEEEIAMQMQAISCKMEDIKSKLEDLEGPLKKEDVPSHMEA